jgi:hypothetical protein
MIAAPAAPDFVVDSGAGSATGCDMGRRHSPQFAVDIACDLTAPALVKCTPSAVRNDFCAIV